MNGNDISISLLELSMIGNTNALYGSVCSTKKCFFKFTIHCPYKDND